LLYFFAPDSVEIQPVDDVAQDYLRLDEFEDGLDKISIIPEICGGGCFHAGDDGAFVFHLDAGGAGIGLRQDESHGGGDDRGDKKDGDDDRLADADHAPIVQKVQSRLGRRGRGIVLIVFHIRL